jgi:hypothetical protein
MLRDVLDMTAVAVQDISNPEARRLVHRLHPLFLTSASLATQSLHLLCNGHPELLLAMCGEYWDGRCVRACARAAGGRRRVRGTLPCSSKAIHKLEWVQRKKILEIFQQASQRSLSHARALRATRS